MKLRKVGPSKSSLEELIRRKATLGDIASWYVRNMLDRAPTRWQAAQWLGISNRCLSNYIDQLDYPKHDYNAGCMKNLTPKERDNMHNRVADKRCKNGYRN